MSLNLNTDIKVLDKVLALNLNISLWSARKKLHPGDFGNVELPPDDLATLGSKKIAPPESLKIFTTIKARAFTLLDRHGIRFLGGWAIPEDKAKNVLEELEQIREEFFREKEKFLIRYDGLIADWLARHSQWTEILQNSTVSPDYVRARMGFSWQLYKVSPSRKKNLNTGLDTGLEAEVQGLGGSLFDEISRTAEEIWKNVYEGKNSVTHKALSPLRTLEQKLSGLTFIEPHVAPVAGMIRMVLEQASKKGNIIGENLCALQGLVLMLKDKEALYNHSDKILQGQDSSETLSELLQTNDTKPISASFWGNQNLSEKTEDHDQEEEQQKTQDKKSFPYRENYPVIADSLGLW